MPDSNPFSPNSGLAFLTGLTSSTMGAFKEQYERDREEEEKAKKVDFELLMAALEQLKPDLTPTQAQEILSRGVDIFKPKGHGGIKDKLAELFGRGKQYEPQSGQIIGDVTGKPRAQIAQPQVSGEGIRPRTVTMPPPPIYEKTYRERALQDRETEVGMQLTKQLQMEEERQQNRLELQEQRNKDIIGRVRELYKYKSDLDAEKDLLKRAVLYNPSNPRDPDAMTRAAADLQQEADIKRQLGTTRIDYQKKRLVQIDEMIKVAQERVRVAANRASSGKAANWNNDPQVKGAWAKVNQYKEQAKVLRTQAAQRYAEGDHAMASKLEEQADIAEASMQDVINNIEQRVNYLNERSGGVTLPNPPGKSRRSGVKLTEKEIRDAGGTDKDVEDARKRGVLAP